MRPHNPGADLLSYRCQHALERFEQVNLRLDSVCLTWFGLEVFTVIMQLFCALFVPAMIVIYSMNIQSLWANSFGPLEPVDGKPAITWVGLSTGDFHLAQLGTGFFGVNGYFDNVYRVALVESEVFIAIGLLRILIHYLAPLSSNANNFKKQPLITLWCWAFSIVCMLHVIVLFSFVGVVICWLLLAVCLDPTRFLPIGTAVVALVGAGSAIAKQMLEAAAAFRDQLLAGFNRFMQAKMREAVRRAGSKMRAERARRSVEAGEGLDVSDDDDEDETTGLTAKEQEGEVTPGEIFEALNVDGDGLSHEEFEKLFELLDLNISQQQRDQLFAYVDSNADDNISEQEFVQGWQKLVEAFADEILESEGLSQMNIFILVGLFISLLGLVLAFVLMALAAWGYAAPSSIFSSVVQSGFVGGLGGATPGLRSKGKAETSSMSVVEEKLKAYAKSVDSEKGEE